MSERADVGPFDGIVVIELSLAEHHEVEHVVGCLRAGAAAIEQTPLARTDATGALMVRAIVAKGRQVAAEIEDEARRVHDAREAAYREQSKPKRGKR